MTPLSITDFETIGILIVGIAYVATAWRSGSGKASIEVIQIYKERVETLSNRVSDLTKELGRLQGEIKGKDDKITFLEQLVQGRNPEQEQYMKDMRKFTKGVADYMASSTKTLTEVSLFMRNINKN